MADCKEIFGDAIHYQVRWKDDPALGELAGRPVRLRFVLRDADLYALQFTPAAGNGK